MTLRPRQEILADYVRILERIYDPVTYAGRLQRLAQMLAQLPVARRVRSIGRGLAVAKCCTGSFPTCPSRVTCSVAR